MRDVKRPRTLFLQFLSCSVPVGIRLDPPEQIALLALKTLPALIASLYSAAGATFRAIPHTRQVALVDALDGRPRATLERYIEQGEAIEARWLLVRVLGISGSSLLIHPIAPEPGWLWTIGIVLTAYALPGQVLSRTIPERAALSLLAWLRPLELLVMPLADPISILAKWAGRSRAGGESQDETALTENEVEILVNEGEMNGSLRHDQSEMIRNVLDFGDLQAGDVMLPRMQVAAISVDTSPGDVLRLAEEKGYSRYPVYRDRIDNVVGFLHIKDLVTHAGRAVSAEGARPDVKIDSLMRTPVVYVPDTQSASSVLKDMRSGHKHHIAIVIDEFGGMAGIITLEDIIEKIVGDIRDEHDDPDQAPALVDLDSQAVMADARVTLAELSRHLGVDLPEDGDYYSLGGFIVEALGRVPTPGTILNKFGFEFIVREADERHISRVEIRPDADSSERAVSARTSSRPQRPRPAA